jgi:2-C-methyl-D-erythritol 4-phosphate cytidylyltransferase
MRGLAVVAVPEAHAVRAGETLVAQGLSAVGVVAVADPASRARCVAAALESFTEQPMHVLIHDIRRPLAPVSVRDRVIDALCAGGSVVMPMLPVTDSVKAVDAHGTVTGTLDRSALRAVQYPRGFTVERLSRLLTGCTSAEFDELDASLAAGASIATVEGDADAFVVELPRDAAYVEAIIACQSE